MLTRSNTAPQLTTPPKSPTAAPQLHTQDVMEPAGKTSSAAAKQNLLGKYVQNATDAAHANGAAGAFGKLKTGGGLATGVAGIGVNAAGLANAIKDGEGGQAISDSALLLGKSVLNTVKGGLDVAAMVQSGKEFKNLKGAAQAALGANGQVGKNIASKVAESVLSGKPLRDVDVLGELAKSKGTAASIGTTLKQGAADALRGLGGEKRAGKLESGIAQAGQKVAASGAHGLTDAAKTGLKTGDAIVDAAKGAEAAARLGAKGAGTAAKAAGRFAPGLNVGIAAIDTAIAAKTIADPKASVASKVTSGITAVLNQVASRTRVELPSELVDEEIRRRWSASEGRSVSELQFNGREQEESLATWLNDADTRAEVEQRLRISLALGAICKRDGLTLTPQVVEKVLRDEAHAAGLTIGEVADALRAEPQHLARIDQVAWHLMAVDHVMSRARIHIEGA